MSVVKKIQLPNETVVDINDNRISVSSPINEQSLVYDNITSKWVNDFALAGSIPFGTYSNNSTSSILDATVNGITELKDGVCVILKGDAVAHAEPGAKLNINSLGAKDIYENLTGGIISIEVLGRLIAPTLFIYDSTLNGWVTYIGFYADTNTDTIGYQLRTNATVRPTISKTRYYRLLFSNPDNTKWVPANTEFDNSAISYKTVNLNPINPFGRIVYLNNTTNYNADANISATDIWDQHSLHIGYSFKTSSTSALTTGNAVYVKCAPQTNGSAIIDSTIPYVQELPSSDDGKIYIYLGQATSTTYIELTQCHPVFYHDGTGIRVWTGKKPLAVSGTDDGTNWTSLTIDGTTKAIPTGTSVVMRNWTVS